MSEEQAQGVVVTWADVPSEQVRPGVRRRGFGTDAVTLVMNEIDPEMQPGPHRHEGFDQIATIVSGEAIYHIGDTPHEVGPGSVLLIPAGVEHWIEPRNGSRVENLDIFAPGRPDYQHLLTWMPGHPDPA